MNRNDALNPSYASALYPRIARIDANFIKFILETLSEQRREGQYLHKKIRAIRSNSRKFVVKHFTYYEPNSPRFTFYVSRFTQIPS